jgi:hypothetical protein
MNKNTNKNTRIAIDQKLLAGLLVNPGKDGSVDAGTGPIKVSDFADTVQRRLDATRAVEVAKSAWLEAVKKERDLLTETDKLFTRLRQALLLKYSDQPDVLAQLGLAVRKAPRQLTADEKAKRAEKAMATRKARGTKGPRARSLIHGAAAQASGVSGNVAPAPSTTDGKGTPHA